MEAPRLNETVNIVQDDATYAMIAENLSMDMTNTPFSGSRYPENGLNTLN